MKKTNELISLLKYAMYAKTVKTSVLALMMALNMPTAVQQTGSAHFHSLKAGLAKLARHGTDIG